MKKYIIMFCSIIMIFFILIFIPTFIYPSTNTLTEPTIVETTTEIITEPTIEYTLTEPTTEPPTTIPYDNGVNWYSDYRVYPSNHPTYLAGDAPIDREFLAKLLFCEAGAMTWEGKVYTCSAILNFCDVEQRTLWEAGHDPRAFEVATYVDNARPTQEVYDVVDYVLAGGRILEICYFRSGGRYHSFGIPVCEVDGHYFSR